MKLTTSQGLESKVLVPVICVLLLPGALFGVWFFRAPVWHSMLWSVRHWRTMIAAFASLVTVAVYTAAIASAIFRD